jgi:hypothetical protein
VIVRAVGAVLCDPLIADRAEVVFVAHAAFEQCKKSRCARNDYAHCNPRGTGHGHPGLTFVSRAITMPFRPVFIVGMPGAALHV